MWLEQSDWHTEILALCIKKSKVIAVSQDVSSSHPPPNETSGTKTSFHISPLDWDFIGDYTVWYLVTARLTTLIKENFKNMHL